MLIVGVAGALALVVGLPVAAQAAPPGVGLTASAAKSTFRAGEPVRLTFSVTNAGSAVCRISRVADGAITMTAMTRDGVPVEPSITTVSYVDGLGPVAAGSLAAVPPAGRADIVIDSAPLDSVDAEQAVPSVAYSPSELDVLTRWPIGTPGRYVATAVYAFPLVAGRPADACPGMSGPATVTFTVAGAAGAPGGHVPVWLIVAIVAGVLIIAVVIWLAIRKRSRRGGARIGASPPAALLVVGFVVAATMLSAVAVVVGAHPAAATISVDAPGDGAFQGAVDACFRKFGAEDGAGDPMKIVTALQFSKHTVIIRREPVVPGRKKGSFATPDSFPDASNRPKDGPNENTGSGSVIDWDPTDAGGNLGVSSLGEPVVTDPCAELYHELYHSYDYDQGTQDATPCRATEHTGPFPGIPNREVAATLAENAYRRYHNLPERSSYGGPKLPESMSECYGPVRGPRTYPSAPERVGSNCDITGCGSTNGDPHVETFDGKRYDFQAAGEFISVVDRDAAQPLEIQVRQSPFPGSAVVSVNRAVAINVAGDRVSLYQDGTGIDVHLDGSPHTFAQGATTLPHGGTLTRIIDADRDSYLVGWPDGSQAGVGTVGGWGLKMTVKLAAARKGRVSGLLGNFDADTTNDLTTRGGATMPQVPSFDQMYRTFGDSWRINQAESLFDYAPGQNTVTFTVRDFPARSISAADLPNRQVAELICRAAGVTTSPYLDDCILDTAVTGQADFVASASDTQGAVTGSTGTPSPTPPPSPAPTTTAGPLHDGDLVSGAITDANQPQRYGLDLGGADRFYVTDWHGTTSACDQTFSINLVDVSNGNFPCTGGSHLFVVPDPGRRYQLEVASARGGTGSYSFRLVTVKPHNFPVTIGAHIGPGQPSGAGHIDTPGREDVFEFEAAGATAIRLTDLPGDCADQLVVDVHDLTTDTFVVGGRPLCGSDLGPFPLPGPTHRYAIVVSSATIGTGEYTFTLTTG